VTKPNYWELRASDVFDWLEPVLTTGEYFCRRSDGRVQISDVRESYTSPWHHIEYSMSADCPWLQALCLRVSPRTPIGQFVPRRCQSCWKIVIRPRTLVELFALEKVLIDLGLPSKCGIERRSYTPPKEKGSRYGGYIYSTSSEEGLERLEKIRSILSEHELLNGVESYLKRACTEFEMRFGDSSKWTVSDRQHEIENLIESLMVIDIPMSHTAKHIRDKVHMTWIEWACENGDKTYLEYTDGKPLYTPAVRYERKAEEVNADTLDSETVDLSPSAGEVPKGRVRRTTKEKKK